jgi:hypothetical protein
MSGRDLDFGPVDRASILPADPIPRLPEADSTPRILTITGGEEVPVAGSSPVMSFLDAENDVVEVAMEPVVGRFETFTIRVLGVPEIAFDLFDCGQQTVTLAATPTDQGGNVGPTVYFSFECVP